MATRQETEAQEQAARDKADGWVSEFLFVVPMFLLMVIVWYGALFGMHYIEWGSFITQN